MKSNSKTIDIFPCTVVVDLFPCCADIHGIVSTHVQAASKLSAPAVTSVSNAANGMTVKWKKVTGSTGYYIYRKTNGSYQKIGTVKKGSTVTYTDKTAKSGTTYIYAVKAYKGKTVSNYGKSAKMKRLSQPSITFSNTSSGVKISWKKISGASKYRVYYKKSGKWVKLADTTSLSYVDKTVSSGSSRTYIVRAISGSCMSSYSSKTIKRLSQPSVKIANTASGVQISWIKISGAAGYHVYRKTTGSFTKIATVKSGISYTDKSAKSGTIYQYTVKAYFGSYSSSYKSVSIKRLSQPVSAASNTGSGVKISWKKISGASKYRVYRRTGSGNWTALGDTTDFYYTDKTAKSGTAYSYAVRAVNGSYISSYTSKSIIRLETPRPSLSNISSGVKISWNKIAGAKSYKVYRKSENGSYAAIGTSASTSFTDKSVTTRTKYTYCAKAVNGNDSSAYGEKTITYYYEENVVLDLVVKDGIATDMVSGTIYPEIAVSGDYMEGGTITLPKSYSNWTYEMIADYNEDSASGIVKLMKFTSNSGKYEECYNVFKLNETNLISSRGSICIPWVKDSWNTGYVVTIPVQIYAHASTDYEFLPTGDIFWSFSMDSDQGILLSRIDGATASTTMSTYTDGIGDTKYVSKILPSSFTLSSDHKVREIKIYDRALTADEQEAAYEKTGIVPPESGICKALNGLTDLGSSYLFTKKGGVLTMLDSQKSAGIYTVGSGSRTISYTISDFKQPDNGIDNSRYESVHITNEPETLETGKQYPLTAYPYPFGITGNDGKADEFDIEWSSSDSSVISVIDGLLIAKNTGTAKITATLMGTNMSDTVTITVTDPKIVEDVVWYVPSDYVSTDGDSFSNTDYEMTTRAIYAAIDEAAANGYNHIVFPKQNFYAVPITDSEGYAIKYYVPSNMTIEFPKGSIFYMVDNEVSRGDPTKIEIHYFDFGVANNDYTGKCEDSHLIMDTYYGERYNTAHSESEYLEENRFVNIGRKAVDCSVEIKNAYYTAGYFIVVDGTCSTNKKTGVMTYGDFVSGWLDENGKLQTNANWISTEDFITVPDYGTDGYFISADGQDSYAGKYWGGCSARQYDVLWYDANQELICTDRFQERGEYYDIPDDAVYFKVSLQQSYLPAPGSDETEDSPWIAMHDDGSAKMCEIKNTKVYNSATGVFSVVGETDGLWVHDCYTNRDGMKPGDERTGDFENGWTAMRHSVVSSNFFNGYFGNPGGFNTFIHTNFLTNYSGFSGETEMLRYINNTTDYVEISEKCQAHVYNNTVYAVRMDKFNTSIGHIYQANNDTGYWVRSY